MTYDADNRLKTQTDPFGLTLTYGYDGNGNTISVSDSRGGVTTSTYDGDNRLISRDFRQGWTDVAIRFTYDGNGNLLSENRYDILAFLPAPIGTNFVLPLLVGSTQTSYDADNRVTGIVQQNGFGGTLMTFAYTYDAGSRLTS